jgi:DNA-binding transcriptional regulator GbsR (MarR family)
MFSIFINFEKIYILRFPLCFIKMENSKPRLTEGKLRTVEKRLVDVLTKMGYLKGGSRKASEITAHIYVNQEVTQKILRTLTGYSLGTISIALQALEKQGVVRKHSHPDTREYHYELDGTISEIKFRSLIDVQRYFSQIKEFLREIEAKLSRPDLSEKKGYENIRRLLDEMKVLIPAYERVMHRFQTFASDVEAKREV